MTIVELVDLDKRRHTDMHGLLVKLDNDKCYVITKLTTQNWARRDEVRIYTQDSVTMIENVTRNQKVQAKPYKDT